MASKSSTAAGLLFETVFDPGGHHLQRTSVRHLNAKRPIQRFGSPVIEGKTESRSPRNTRCHPIGSSPSFATAFAPTGGNQLRCRAAGSVREVSRQPFASPPQGTGGEIEIERLTYNIGEVIMGFVAPAVLTSC